jgi:hypothetical protein
MHAVLQVLWILCGGDLSCSLIPLDAPAMDALATAVDRYGAFLGMPAMLAVRS